MALLIVAVLLVNRIVRENRETAATDTDAAAAAHIPVITEIMASNRSALVSDNGETYDWFEVTNTGADPLELRGFMITDSLEKPLRYTFGDSVLAPGQSVVIFCGGPEYAGVEGFAPFRIKASGEALYVLNSYGDVLSAVDVPAMAPDTSYALNTASNEWYMTEQYTPGYPNTQDGWNQFMATRRVENPDVLIWEVMTSNKITCSTRSGDYYDWVELHNMTDQPIDLKDWGLSDSESDLRKYVFGETVIEPNGYLLIFCNKEGYGVEGEIVAQFGLNSLKESVVLSNPKGQIVDSVTVERIQSDNSYGRVSRDMFKTFTKPTPGYPNTDDGYQAFQTEANARRAPGVLINEVKTIADEYVTDEAGNPVPWVELTNNSADTLDLKGYGMTNSAKHIGLWTFPSVSIAPGQKLLVFTDGSGDSSAGELHTNFKLKVSGGDVLIISDAEGRILDSCMVDRIPETMSYGRPKDQRSFAYLMSPSPRSDNNGSYAGAKCDQPAFSLATGNYVSAQQLEIFVPENTTVRYTLDGSKPGADSPVYGGPISIDKNTVVRAASFRDGFVTSEVTTETIFINEPFDLPLVSISVDPKEMFDDMDGLYMRGPDQTYPYNGSNFMSNRELEANIELLETDGTVGLSTGFGLRIFGAFSRYEDKKSFACMSRPVWGDERFRYQIFPDLANTSYDSFILRTGASEWHMSMIRDVVISKLAAQYTDLDVQASRPCIVFINGEYWGVYFLQEKINASYFEDHYGVSKSSVNLLVGNGRSRSEVKYGSNASYLELLNYCKEHDLSNSSNYEWVKAHMDVKNYAQYVATEMYTTNTDTGNIKFWMSEEYDGRWRWILYDTDWALLRQNAQKNYTEEYIDPRGHGVGNGFDTDIIIALLKNPEFKQLFLETCAYITNTVYSEESLIGMVNEVAGQIDSSMERDRNRWSPCDREGGTMVTLSYKGWLANVESIRTFARTRRDYFIEDVQQDLHVGASLISEIFGDY